jgi:hypothetical protein
MLTSTKPDVHAASAEDPEELTVAEAHAMFNRLSRDRLGISRRDFLARLDRGEYDNTDSEDVIRLRILAPFAR